MTTVYITAATETQTVDPGYSIYLIDATSGNITLTLPDINSDGLWFLFRRIDTINANSVTIQGYSSGQTIDGLANFVLTPSAQEAATASYGGVWYRL